MKKYIFIFLAVVCLGFLAGCEKETDNNYGTYPISWLPVTDWQGEALKPIYTEGDTINISLRFKNFDENEVTGIDLYQGIIDDNGEVQEKEKVGEFSTSDFEYLPEQMQYQVKMHYVLTVGEYTDQRLQLSAVVKTSKNTEQTRILASFTVAEYFEHIIEGVNYYYMYDNSYEDDALGYTVEHSAAYTAMVTVMNHFGFDEENANFQGELGGNINAHTPDWMASWYLYYDVNGPAQNVPDFHKAYRLEASWYGGPKRLHSTELGTYEQIDQAIINGQMVVLHGDFRGDFDFKHQLIIVASSDHSFLALDPAGQWNQELNGTHIQNPEAGSYVKYAKDAVYTAIGETGQVWMHIAVDPEDEMLELAD